VPQAKAAFADAQQTDPGAEGLVLDFGELLEAVARCGVVKYKGVPMMEPAHCVRGMAQNILGDKDEEAQQEVEGGCLQRHGGLLLMMAAPVCVVLGIAIAVLVVKYSGDSDNEPTSRPARLLADIVHVVTA